MIGYHLGARVLFSILPRTIVPLDKRLFQRLKPTTSFTNISPVLKWFIYIYLINPSNHRYIFHKP